MKTTNRKPIHWLGSTLDDIKQFPDSVKRELGFELDLVQQGLSPRDFKPMQNLGSGVMEIRVRDASGAFRLVYVAKFQHAIYCLHVSKENAENRTERSRYYQSTLPSLKGITQ